MTSDKYLESPILFNRIRQEAPVELGVIENSLPIVSFGNPMTSKVVSIALNPSWKEFLKKTPSSDEKVWLDDEDRRVESLRSLGKLSAAELTDQDVQKIVNRCHLYFQYKPYDTWFKPLNNLLQIVGGDYYQGTASHLDLVQWATTEVQGDLGPEWNMLVDQDAEFLRWQLDQTPARVVIMNGKQIVDNLISMKIAPELATTTLSYQKSNGSKGTFKIYLGNTGDRTFIGWNIAVQRGIPRLAREKLLSILESNSVASDQN